MSSQLQIKLCSTAESWIVGRACYLRVDIGLGEPCLLRYLSLTRETQPSTQDAAIAKHHYLLITYDGVDAADINATNPQHAPQQSSFIKSKWIDEDQLIVDGY
jgi:hypothetical protein